MEEPVKRVVFGTGDKGGTGKSTWIRGLLDVYRYRGINCLAYDCDKRNSQLHRHYHRLDPGVKQADIFTRGGADSLLIDLDAQKPDVVLVDLPAQSGEFFERFEADLGLFKAIETLGYRATMVSVISRVKDSIGALKLLMDYCGSQVDYVVVKNLFYGDERFFNRYDSSKTRTAFLEQGGIEMLMPDLYWMAYDLVDDHNLTFREATKAGDLIHVVNRSRIFQWLSKLEEEMAKASPLLGLEPVKVG